MARKKKPTKAEQIVAKIKIIEAKLYLVEAKYESASERVEDLSRRNVVLEEAVERDSQQRKIDEEDRRHERYRECESLRAATRRADRYCKIAEALAEVVLREARATDPVILSKLRVAMEEKQ